MLTKPQVFYDDTHKQALGYQNPFYLKKAQWIKPTLYDGSAISKKNDVISVVDEEETLILEEESRSQMLAKQNDPISKENKVNISSINYSKLNKLAKDFGKHFVPQKEFVCMNKHLFYKFQTLTLNNLDVPPNTLLKERSLLNFQKVIQKLEQHCISLEVAMQLNQEIFQRDKSCENQNAPEFQEFFNNNDLKAQIQAKDTTISNLKKQIHSLKAKCNQATMKMDIDPYETINIELEHSVAKLLRENEHLHKEREHFKKTYKELYDSIKKTRVQTKDCSDSLIAQLNQKSVKNADLNAQI
ncbi:hypothetical protein Tco_1533144 [Tanacetum coccineum]